MVNESKDPFLIACPDVASYDDVVDTIRAEPRECLLPVFSDKPSPAPGLPSAIVSRPYRTWRERENKLKKRNKKYAIPPLQERAIAGRICISVDDPHCMAVSRFLCQAAEKELILCSRASEWEDTVRERVEDPMTTSLTFVLPLWEPQTHILTPSWIERTIRLMRALDPKVERLSWGLLTGANETILSFLAVKAVLQQQILQRYNEFPAAIFDALGEKTKMIPLPSLTNDPKEKKLQELNQQNETTSLVHQLTQQSWSALIFRGHGRSYCACNGFLCGARSVDQNPEQENRHCILNLQCADATYPRIDPRRFDTPVMIMDTCGTGNWAISMWNHGIPSLAFLALSGAAGAVITSDGIPQSAKGDGIDVIRALTTSTTLGEAVVKLNQMRISGNVRLPYVLLGDPDIVAGETRWPAWTTQASFDFLEDTTEDTSRQGHIPVSPDSSPFLRLHLTEEEIAQSQGPWTIAIWPDQPIKDGLSCKIFSDQTEHEIWVDLSGLETLPTSLRTEAHATLSFPKGLVEAAESLLQRALFWHPPLDTSIPRLITASRQIVQVGQYIPQFAHKVIGSCPEDVTLAVKLSLDEWIRAQADCIQLALSSFLTGGIWPSDLWPADRFEAHTLEKECPNCGRSPMTCRGYQVASNYQRYRWECMECDLVADQPVISGYPRIALRAPTQLGSRGKIVCELEIDQRSGEVDCLGAGAVVVAREGHGITSQPSQFPLCIKSGDCSKTVVTLYSGQSIPISHLYKLRAVVLLNGHWFWASRPLLVSEGVL